MAKQGIPGWTLAVGAAAWLCAGCQSGARADDAGVPDVGRADAGADGGLADAGPDGGLSDAGRDGGGPDAGTDAGSADAGIPPDLDGGAPLLAYVASAADGKIFVYSVDPATASLQLLSAVDAGVGPSFLALDPARLRAFAAISGADALASFSVNPANGSLTPVNTVSSQGSLPAAVALDRTGRFLLNANYTQGNAVVFPVGSGGAIGPPVSLTSPGAAAHQLETDPSNRFAFVPCLGSDYVAQFLFDPDAGTLTPNAVPTLTTVAGAGPRRLAFHPNGRWAYLINETDSTLTALSLDLNTGQLTALQTVSTLPVGFAGANTGAEVQVHPSGRFVYSSNRGHDSIAGFALDGDGGITPIGFAPTGGRTPRHFSFDPQGALLFAANQDSGTVFAFRVNLQSGLLTSLGQVAQVNAPQFVGLINLKP